MANPPDYLAQLKSAYPKRAGGQVWAAAERFIVRHIEEGESFELMLKGATTYSIHCRRKQMEGTEYVLMARTFFGRDKHWLEWSEMDLRTPAQIAQDTKWAALQVRVERLGFTTLDRAKGYDIALHVVEAEERKRASNVLDMAGLRAKVVR